MKGKHLWVIKKRLLLTMRPHEVSAVDCRIIEASVVDCETV